MFGNLRHWAVAGALIPGLAMCVLASPGYLPVIGPVPLRFIKPPPPPSTNLASMTPPSPEPEFYGPPAPSADELNAMAPPPAPIVDTNPPAAASMPLPASTSMAPDPMISPQMLLKYFNRSTNGTSSGVVAPMELAPPGATKPPSSTATYSTGPN